MAESKPRTQTEKKYDVFLVHCSDDLPTARQINNGLLKNGLKTYASYREGQQFGIGRNIITSIQELVNISDTILILLTPTALESSWVSFEILLGLEKAHLSDKMCIRLLLYNVTDEQRNEFPDLEYIPYIRLDFNRDNWTDNLYEEIVKSIKADTKMPDILPAGNVAHGLVFNYFAGFLKHVLPALKSSLEKNEVYIKSKDRVLTQFCILLPESCRVTNIEGVFKSYVIQREGSLEVKSGHGDKERTYNPSLYSITKNDDKEIETFWFVCECPTIMETIAKLAESEFVEKFDKKMQVGRFRKTLMDFVNHKKNTAYNCTVAFVDYDDEKTTHAEQLWRRIVQEMQVTTGEVNLTRTVGKLSSNKTKKYFATVTNSVDGDADKEVATEVMDFLKKKTVSFTNGDECMGYDYLSEARWNIFVVSKESVKDDKMLHQYNAAVQESVNDNQVQVIPILTKGTHIEDIPQRYIWTIVLQSSEPNYLERLWATLEGEANTMHELWPAGKIYEGLAWSYMLNYLPINLGGTTADGKVFQHRFQDAMVKNNLNCKCIPRLFVIVPKTCSFPPPGRFFEGETHIGSIEPAVVGFRKYFLQMYQITLENGEDVCYAREYATPAVTLHMMAHDFPSSGLNVDKMYTQSAKFAKFVETIINGEGYKKDIGDITDKCTVVYFEDDRLDIHGMTNDLKRRLSECVANGDFIATPRT